MALFRWPDPAGVVEWLLLLLSAHGWGFGASREQLMGWLHYGSNGLSVEIEDRQLAHLRSVIVSKLKRDEKFTFTWPTIDSAGRAGRCMVWLHPAIELHFLFDTDERWVLNRRWVDVLSQMANSGDGLGFIAEPVQERVSQ